GEQAEALDRAALLGVQHVDEAVALGERDREGASRGDRLAQEQTVAEDREDRDRAAARVDRQQQPLLAIEQQRALRGEVIYDRAFERPAQAAGRVEAGRREDPP